MSNGQLQRSRMEWAMAGASIGCLSVIQLVIIYCAATAIRNRTNLHIAKRNLAVILVELFTFAITNMSVMGRLILLSLGYRGPSTLETWFTYFSTVSYCLPTVVLTGGQMVKLYIIVLTFRGTGAAAASNQSTLPQACQQLNKKCRPQLHSGCPYHKMMGRLITDCRTVRGQHIALLQTCALGVLFSILSVCLERRACLRLCKEEFAPFGSLLWINIPLGGLLGWASTGVVAEFKKLGDVDDDLGIIRAFKRGNAFTAVVAGPITTSLVVADFGVATQSLGELGAILTWAMFMGYLFNNYLYFMVENHLSPCSASRGRKQKVFPTLVTVRSSSGMEAGSVTAALAQTTTTGGGGGGGGRSPSAAGSSQPSTLGSPRSLSHQSSPHNSDAEGGSPRNREEEWERRGTHVLQLSAFLLTLPDHEAVLVQLYEVGRRHLSEEAMRCAVTISRLQILKLSSSEDREKMRGLWREVLTHHIEPNAPWPVSLDNEDRRFHLIDTLSKGIRRKVIFPDDCTAVRTQLVKVVGILAPGIEELLSRFVESRWLVEQPKQQQAPPQVEGKPTAA